MAPIAYDSSGNKYIDGKLVEYRKEPEKERKMGLLETLIDIFREDDSPHDGWGDSYSNGPDYGGGAGG